MKKFSLKKWKEVLWVASFTTKQQMKTKSCQIAFVLLLMVAVFGPFVAGFMKADKEQKQPQNTTIENLYVVEELRDGLSLPYGNLRKIPFYKDLRITRIDSNEKKKVKNIKDELEHTQKNQILLEVFEGEEFMLTVYVPRESSLWGSEGDYLLQKVKSLLKKERKKKANLSKKQQEIIDSKMDTTLQMIYQDGSIKEIEKDPGIAYGEYTCIYGFIFLLLMIGVYAGSAIASSVVSEKNGRLLEYLLTAVSPFSLLMGKIIGIFSLVIVEMLSVGCVTKVSDYLAAGMYGNQNSVLAGMIPDTIWEHLTFFNMMVSVFFIVLNLVFFGFLAAFSGTRAGRVEELKDTMMVFSIGELIGGYLAMFSSIYMMEETTGIFLNFSYIFPLSSSFLLPGAIFTGRIDWKILLVSGLLLVICVSILIPVTVKSYQKHLFSSVTKEKRKGGQENER